MWVGRSLQLGFCLPHSRPNLPSAKMEHSLHCQHGGYLIHWPNDLWNHTASLLIKVCSDISAEPQLQPLLGQQLTLHSANWVDSTRLDAAAASFELITVNMIFFEIWVFNPLTHYSHTFSINSYYQKHEQEKWGVYDQWVGVVESGCFSPLAFNTLGGTEPTAWVVYKRLASLIAAKTCQPYSIVIQLIRSEVKFCLLCSTINCLQGSQHSKSILSSPLDIDLTLALAENQVPCWIYHFSKDYSFFSVCHPCLCAFLAFIWFLWSYSHSFLCFLPLHSCLRSFGTM